MSTGTIQDAAPVVIKNIKHDALQMSFVVANGGGSLVVGQPVSMQTNGTLKAQGVGTDPCIGVVIKGAGDGERATVRTVFTTEEELIAGGTLLAGALVRHNNVVDADGYPTVVAAATGEFACGVVLKGGAVGEKIIVGIIDGIVVAP